MHVFEEDYTDVLTVFPYPQTDPSLPEHVWIEYLKRKNNTTQEIIEESVDKTVDKTKKSDANVTLRSDNLDC
jgi:hypothetical protein